jgi:hypothetical protein
LPEIVRRLDELDAIVVQPSSDGAVSLFRFQHAQITGPVEFRIESHHEALTADARAQVASRKTRPQTMESRVEESLAKFPAIAPSTAGDCMEHLAIVKRWYYRSHRIGEIFFADRNGTWPLRRIVRGIGRVSKRESPQELPSFPATLTIEPPS